LAPSDGALSGLSCVSKKIVETPTATAALDNELINFLSPPLLSPLPPGCWTE